MKASTVLGHEDSKDIVSTLFTVLQLVPFAIKMNNSTAFSNALLKTDLSLVKRV